jgi:hypothetical protein
LAATFFVVTHSNRSSTIRTEDKSIAEVDCGLVGCVADVVLVTAAISFDISCRFLCNDGVRLQDHTASQPTADVRVANCLV